MDLHKCKSFYTVAKCGSFSRAAEQLFLTQPAVSAQIKDLEYEYKAKLFERVGRTVKLTPAGEALIPYVDTMLSTYDESHIALETMKDRESGSVRLGVSDLPGARLVPSCLATFLGEHPNVRFSITTRTSRAVLDMLSRHEIDLGIIGTRDIDLKRTELTGRVLLRDEIVVAVSRRHPLASHAEVTVEELSEVPIIVAQKNTVSRQAIDRLFRRHTIPHTIAYEIGNKSMIKSMVEHNLGVAFFSNLEIRKEAESEWIKVLPVRDAQLYRYIQVVYHRSREQSPSCDMFCEFLFSRGDPREAFGTS